MSALWTDRDLAAIRREVDTGHAFGDGVRAVVTQANTRALAALRTIERGEAPPSLMPVSRMIPIVASTLSGWERGMPWGAS